MRLALRQSYALLEKHGCFVCEACDKCGQILGPVRFTRLHQIPASPCLASGVTENPFAASLK
jgi:hypothetical protein